MRFSQSWEHISVLGLKGRRDVHVSFVGCIVFAYECMPPLPPLSGVSAVGFPVPGETSGCLCTVFIFPGLAVLVMLPLIAVFWLGWRGLSWWPLVVFWGFLYLFFLLDLFLRGLFFVSWFGELCLYGRGEAEGVAGLGTRGRATYSACHGTEMFLP